MRIDDSFFSADVDRLSVLVRSAGRARTQDVFAISLIRLSSVATAQEQIKLLRVIQIALNAIEPQRLGADYGLPTVYLLRKLFREGEPELRRVIVDVLGLLFLAVNGYFSNVDDQIRDFFDEAKADSDDYVKSSATDVLSEGGLLNRPKPQELFIRPLWQKHWQKPVGKLKASRA